MRFLYLGLPLGALCLAARGHRPAVIGSWHLEAPGHRRLRRVLASQGTLLLARPNLEDPTVEGLVRTLAPEAILSWYWPRRIPEAILALAPWGAYGVHPSLLPRWRGPDPTFHTVRAGDGESGVTLHRLEGTYDTGAIIEQRRIPVDGTWTSAALERALDPDSLALLVRAADLLADQRAPLPGRPQDATAATEAPRPTDAELAIDWAEPAAAICRLVRAAAPAPGASALLGKATVAVLAASVSTAPIPPGLRPAESLVDDDGTVRVVAGDGLSVALETVVSLAPEDAGRLLPAAEVADLVRDR